MNNPADKNQTDEMQSEYDLEKLGPGVRGKYYERYMQGTNLALLDPEIRTAFPTDQAVNAALRSLLNASHSQQTSAH